MPTTVFLLVMCTMSADFFCAPGAPVAGVPVDYMRCLGVVRNPPPNVLAQCYGPDGNRVTIKDSDGRGARQ